MSDGSVGRRVESAFDALNKNDYETALIHLFPAIDNTARKRRPDLGVGKRIKEFINDEIAIITLLGMGTVLVGCTFDGKSIPEAIYDMARNPLIHEGQLDEKLSFSTGTRIVARSDKWVLPVGFIWALMLAVITAPENSDETTLEKSFIRNRKHIFLIKDLWGNKKQILDCYPQLKHLNE